jgi:hypothetical protein
MIVDDITIHDNSSIIHLVVAWGIHIRQSDATYSFNLILYIHDSRVSVQY